MSGEANPHPPRFTVRAELVIRGNRSAGLRGELLKPDPLERFANVFDELRADLGDDARVTVDLVPLSRRRRRAWRRHIRRSGNQSRRPVGDDLADAFNLQGTSSSSERVDQAEQTARLTSRLREDVHLFGVQVMIEISSEINGRPQKLLPGFVAAFGQFAAVDAHWSVSGLPVGRRFLFGSDWWPRRWWFNVRMRSGYFAPASRKNVVAAREIAGLLKPPSKHCNARNVVRSSGDVAPAPRDIPVYRRKPGVIPIGMSGGEMIGMSTDEFFFGYVAGRARFGKTESALSQLLHAALVEGTGAFFLDPHQDALVRTKPFLANDLAIDRVIELNFSNNDENSRHVGWNPLSMEGRRPSEIAGRAQAMVDAASIVQSWGSTASRIPIITGQAALTMLHLSLRLHPENSPTMFTMVRFLQDEKYRKHVIPFLPGHLQEYWERTYPTYIGDAHGPLVNMIARITRPPVARATLGSPRSTYDARRAMDEQSIILACPGSGMEGSMASFIVYDLLYSAMSRADMDRDERKPFYVFLDELQSYDDGHVVPNFMEQCGKYGTKVIALNQSPHRLSPRTLDAISTNSSFLITTATSAEGAAYFDKQWTGAGTKGLVSKLPRYHYLAQLTHAGGRTEPFRVAGLPIEQVWRSDHPDLRIPDKGRLPELERSIDERCRPRTIKETLKAIEGHDDRVLEALLSGEVVRPVVPDEPSDAEERLIQNLEEMYGLDSDESGAEIPPEERAEPPADDDDDFQVDFGG